MAALWLNLRALVNPGMHLLLSGLEYFSQLLKKKKKKKAYPLLLSDSIDHLLPIWNWRAQIVLEPFRN